jgi:hypothetical protein
MLPTQQHPASLPFHPVGHAVALKCIAPRSLFRQVAGLAGNDAVVIQTDFETTWGRYSEIESCKLCSRRTRTRAVTTVTVPLNGVWDFPVLESRYRFSVSNH